VTIENKKKSLKKTINVGVAGSIETDTGQKTQTLIEQINSLKNLRVKMFYNKNCDAARSILQNANLLKDSVYISHSGKNHLDSGIVYTDNSEIFIDSDEIDIYIITEINAKDASEIIYNCLNTGKLVVNLNAISEATLGVIFKEIASCNDTIYSVGAGDEPAVTLDLINYCRMLGLEIICAGKGKNNPLNIYSNPDDFIKKSNEIDVSPYLLASFVDGTKTMLEMAILSNAADIPIDIDGMHGPEANIRDLVRIFDLKSKGGILNKYNIIDYAIGDIAPGVFVIFTSRQASIIKELQYLKMGTGPNFILFKPYHLGNIESPFSIYDIVLNKKPTLTANDKFRTMVAARAKKNLSAGTTLDFSGGYSFSGYAIDFQKFVKNNYAPLGLIEGSILKENVVKDEIITFSKIDKYKSTCLYNLWEKQIKILK